MNPDDIRTDPRLAGRVVRYHTWPQVGQQTVAEHGWNVARIVLAIAPDAPGYVISHALFHDVGEIKTGDLPYPIKKDNPSLKKVMDELEIHARIDMSSKWLLSTPESLDEHWRRLIKLADMMEMFEWAIEQLNIGNRYARPVFGAVMPFIQGEMISWPDSAQQERIKFYVGTRLFTLEAL